MFSLIMITESIYFMSLEIVSHFCLKWAKVSIERECDDAGGGDREWGERGRGGALGGVLNFG